MFSVRIASGNMNCKKSVYFLQNKYSPCIQLHFWISESYKLARLWHSDTASCLWYTNTVCHVVSWLHFPDQSLCPQNLWVTLPLLASICGWPYTEAAGS